MINKSVWNFMKTQLPYKMVRNKRIKGMMPDIIFTFSIAFATVIIASKPHIAILAGILAGIIGFYLVKTYLIPKSCLGGFVTKIEEKELQIELESGEIIKLKAPPENVGIKENMPILYVTFNETREFTDDEIILFMTDYELLEERKENKE